MEKRDMRVLYKKNIAILALGVVCSVLAAQLQAGLEMPQVFGNEMVLQRDKPIHVWGRGDPGCNIIVSFKGNVVKTVVDKDGKWMVTLPKLKADFKNSDLRISCSSGDEVVFHDVLVGEVWICSGQSNMELNLKYAYNSYTEVKNATQRSLRLFSLKGITWTGKPYTREQMNALKKGPFFSGKWTGCTPDTAKDFSAVAYYFGSELSKKLNVPVGLICNAVGGSPIESWLSRKTLASNPDLAPILKGDWYDMLTSAWGRQSAKQSLKPWFTAVEEAKKNSKKLPPRPGHVFEPTFLYEHMLKPLAPFAMRGVIWYQGESNERDGYAYYMKFAALIHCWRVLWNVDFPFYFVQLPNFGGLSSDGIRRIHYDDRLGSWALIREAQRAVLSIPRTAMAVSIDLGDRKTIHPKDKKDVGHRLALLARHYLYGEKELLSEGPKYESMETKGNKIFLKFSNVGGGLAGNYGYLDAFSIAGDDRVFHPAVARVIGKKESPPNIVEVHSDVVDKPVAVRYGWTTNPECTLYNCENGKNWPPYLPASPFRTDNWPLKSEIYKIQ